MTRLWQPIETAPKNGTTILVKVFTGAAKAAWIQPIYGGWVEEADGRRVRKMRETPEWWVPLQRLPTRYRRRET